MKHRSTTICTRTMYIQLSSRCTFQFEAIPTRRYRSEVQCIMRQAARSNDTKQKHIKAFEVMHSKRRRGGKQHTRSRHPRRAWRKPGTKSPLTCTGVARGHRALTLYAPRSAISCSQASTLLCCSPCAYHREQLGRWRWGWRTTATTPREQPPHA